MGMAAVLFMWPEPGDLNRLNKLFFPHPLETQREIWLWLAYMFQRRICVKNLVTSQKIKKRRYTIFHSYFAFIQNRVKIGKMKRS